MRIITLTSSTIAYYLQCPEKWNLGYNQNLRPVPIEVEKTDQPMDKGTAIHKLLEFYYIERLEKDVFTSAQQAIINYLASPEANLPVDHKFIIQRFRDYVIRYQGDDFKPIKLANIPSTEVGFSYVFYEDQYKKCILEGKIDLISTIEQDMILVDHKSQGRFATLYQYRPQFLTYSLVSGIRKLVVNYIGFQKEIKENVTFRRHLITIPEWKIEQWEKKVGLIFEQIGYSLDNKEVFTQNPESCGGPFSSYYCPYTAICEINPANKELIANVKNFKYEVKPYESWTLPEEL